MPNSKKTIWVVDDDCHVRTVFGHALRTGAGYRVVECEDGRAALDRLASEAPALFVLDVNMPRLDGWQTLEELRRRGFAQPVLMITDANDVTSRVRGLEAGADDYIGKPCRPEELCTRVRALLRRATPKIAPAPLRIGDVTIDLESKTATKAGGELRLTRTDYALLTLLRENLGKPVSRELILKRVWEGQSGGSHALDTHLWRLRRKIGGANNATPWLRNEPGIGYAMTLPP